MGVRSDGDNRAPFKDTHDPPPPPDLDDTVYKSTARRRHPRRALPDVRPRLVPRGPPVPTAAILSNTVEIIALGLHRLLGLAHYRGATVSFVALRTSGATPFIPRSFACFSQRVNSCGVQRMTKRLVSVARARPDFFFFDTMAARSTKQLTRATGDALRHRNRHVQISGSIDTRFIFGSAG